MHTAVSLFTLKYVQFTFLIAIIIIFEIIYENTCNLLAKMENEIGKINLVDIDNESDKGIHLNCLDEYKSNLTIYDLEDDVSIVYFSFFLCINYAMFYFMKAFYFYLLNFLHYTHNVDKSTLYFNIIEKLQI